MAELESLINGIHNFMLRVQVPFFGRFFSLWDIFLVGMFAGVCVWALKKFLG